MDLMANFRTAIYLFSLSVLAGPTAPLVTEAVSLRAQMPGRSEVPAAAATGDTVSPADLEDEEELLEQSSGGDQPPLRATPAAEPQLPQAVDLPSPSLRTSAATVQQTADIVPQPEVPARQQPPQQIVDAVQPVLPAVPKALVQFPPPRGPPPSAAAAVAGGNRRQDTHIDTVQMGLARANASLGEASLQSKPSNWPPSDKSYSHCDPPCIEGRGLCNDNICFCRSPFSGSTCQHKETGLYRAPKIMVFGFSVFCFLLGIFLSKFIFTFSEHAIETRLERYGSSKRKYEMWSPPEQDKDKKKGAS